jgi:DNA replication protein DnaC
MLGDLIQAEKVERQTRSIRNPMKVARFPALKDRDGFDSSLSQVNEGRIRTLYTGVFLDGAGNIIFVGGIGTGKSHLAITFATHSVRQSKRCRYFSMVDLVNKLEREQSDGLAGRTAEKLLKLDLLVLDELGYLPFFKKWWCSALPLNQPPL